MAAALSPSASEGGEKDTPQEPQMDATAPPMEMANFSLPMVEIDRFGSEEYGEWAEYGYTASEVDLTDGLGQATLTQATLAYDPRTIDPSKYKYLFSKPSTFEEAWDHPEPFQREKWREAIKKELEKMGKLKESKALLAE